MDFMKVGSRIKEERERRQLTQEQLAELAGLKNRHSVAAIEKGERDVRYWELLNIADSLGIDLAEVAPQRTREAALMPQVLWRKEPGSHKVELEADFVQRIRSYALLERALFTQQSPAETLEIFDIEPQSFGYKQAYDLAETMRERLVLGNEPAKSLAKVLEDQCAVRIFFVDLEGNGSAASYRVGNEVAVLLNSAEPPWRRNFSLAHELFHLVTWSPKVLSKIQESAEFRQNIEKYAEAFAAGLLMPAEHLRREFDKLVQNGKVSWTSLLALARQFEVSTTALLYRLSYIGRLDRESVSKLLSDPEFLKEDRADMHDRWTKPPEFPDRFVRLAFRACANGSVSRAKVSELLKITLVDLPTFFENYGFQEGAEDEIQVNFA